MAITNIKRGVLDISTNEALKRIASRSHSRFLALGGEFDEWIKYGTSVHEDGFDRFKDLAEQYLLNPSTRTIRTQMGQEMRLVGQSGMGNSLFDEAASRIKDMIRLGVAQDADYPPGFMALVQSG